MTIEREDTRLTAYALDELSEVEKEGFEADLEGDADALRELRAIEETLGAVREELRRGDAPKLEGGRRQAIEEQSERSAGKVRRRRPVVAVSAFVALAAGLALFVGVGSVSMREKSEVSNLSASGTPVAAPTEQMLLEPPREQATATEKVPEKAADKAVGSGMEGYRPKAALMESSPDAAGNGERYDHARDNPFVRVASDPRSTFSIDVDTASYALVRRHLLDQRALPPPGAVRIEELVNYFDYAYPEPTDGRPFSVQTDVASAPWAPGHRLLRIGIKGKHLAPREISGANLVFLIDVSGSMTEELPLVKRGLALLAERLQERDRVAMVVYAGTSGLVLPPTRGNNRRAILDAIERLEAGGSTNGGQGIELAYRQAREAFVQGGVNRVILATDGDFNVGVTNESDLVELIERQAKSGVFLSVLGFGMGNYNDSMLEKLADKGNGNYAYVDSFAEARKVLVEQASGTLVTIAKDVKIQIEFNPTEVESFRLLGYENRVLAHKDFNDDRKDAGEIGADHRVTALYEIVPAGGSGSLDPLKYQPSPARRPVDSTGELATIKLRYKSPEGSTSELMEVVARDDGAGIARASSDFRFAAAVAELGMVLRNSPHKGQASYEGVLELATGTETDERRREFLRMVRAAKSLAAPR